jgi:TPR repeat protein
MTTFGDVTTFRGSFYGIYLGNGGVVVQDFAKAAEFYKLAADQGAVDGQLNYGFCLENGCRTLSSAADMLMRCKALRKNSS